MNSFTKVIAEEIELDKDQQVKIAKKYIETRDTRYRNRLISSNVRLVLNIMSREFFFPESSTDDVFQEGVLGIVEAAERFDPKKSQNFSNYAASWIKNKIRKYIAENHKQFSSKLHVVHKAALIDRAKMAFVEENGREPTTIELCKITKISPKSIDIYAAQGGEQVYLDDQDLDSDKRSELVGLSDENSLPDAQAMQSEDFGILNGLVSKDLTENERFVIQHRFKLDGKNNLTFVELGEKLGCSYEWARILERRALKKLKKGFELKT